jgi:CheY-like chemotaxis protein
VPKLSCCKQKGYSVRVAQDERKGLDRWRKGRLQYFILLDFKMPSEDNGAHRGMRRQTRMRLPRPAKTH